MVNQAYPPLIYGNDFALHKPTCDVLFDACAHSPTGQPVKTLGAGFQIGSLTKVIQVHGVRFWRQHFGMMSLSNAEPFTYMPLHYDLAFGGSLVREPDDANSMVDTYLPNPIGSGWASSYTRKQLINQRAPSLEYAEDTIKNWNGKHRPAALGAIGSHWRERAQFAGTMDEQWQKRVFPFLPEDFDTRFHQVAPRDQQMPYPIGGEPVVLINLMKDKPRIEFQLPAIGSMPVRVLRKDYSSELLHAVADTLFFEPEENRFSAVWRTKTPLRKNLREIDCVATGKVSAEWWHNKMMGTEGCETCGKNKEKA